MRNAFIRASTTAILMLIVSCAENTHIGVAAVPARQSDSRTACTRKK